ncbi:hypothetical protein CO659_20900 [Rhizobium sp. S9]|uniref:Uncharacterized protein n=1 Tax=Rhizobium etli (strain ATCC 51251 / DSM 11541 / JCM 21823 / NBRC 15573 / CFN 42) TaxID=347834 RepID=Q2KB69_RHIEC|nr:MULTISPECIES: hypothetical protein [Rhizobium]ABC89917.1 hypothetical protein RHE_CH01110 [Rhizobium etli CFN 42]ARO23049.1 hypothetical protein TAL182_CH01237 [Rhizobium sp. TAL182]PDS95983.1 hypothetical protein CO659_20900 [Rhizobium sp. S9]
MKLIRNKRRGAHVVAVHVVRLLGLLELLPYVVPHLDDFIPKWLSIGILLMSPIARVIHQKNLKDEQAQER